MKKILNRGFGNIGYQLGTGILSDWAGIDEERIKKLNWKLDDHYCEECGEPLEYALVCVPYHLVLFRCKNGHKYHYENTD